MTIVFEKIQRVKTDSKGIKSALLNGILVYIQ